MLFILTIHAARGAKPASLRVKIIKTSQKTLAFERCMTTKAEHGTLVEAVRLNARRLCITCL